MRTFAVALASVALLAGCGGGGGGNANAQPAGSIKITMTEFKFEPSALSAPTGAVVFFLINSGTTSHDMVIRDSTGKRLAASELVSAGDSFVFTVSTLAAGTYKFFCDQPGHEASGMFGSLTIT